MHNFLLRMGKPFLTLVVAIEGILLFLIILNVFYIWQSNNQLLFYLGVAFLLGINTIGIFLNQSKKIAAVLVIVSLIYVIPLLFFDYFIALYYLLLLAVVYRKTIICRSRSPLLYKLIMLLVSIAVFSFSAMAVVNEVTVKGNIFVFNRDLSICETTDENGHFYYKVSKYADETDEFQYSYLSIDDVIDLYPFGRFYLRNKVFNIHYIG